jgi:hypothetical protein
MYKGKIEKTMLHQQYTLIIKGTVKGTVNKKALELK